MFGVVEGLVRVDVRGADALGEVEVDKDLCDALRPQSRDVVENLLASAVQRTPVRTGVAVDEVHHGPHEDADGIRVAAGLPRALPYLLSGPSPAGCR